MHDQDTAGLNTEGPELRGDLVRFGGGRHLELGSRTTSPKFSDLFDQLAGDELQLDVLRVELAAVGEAGPNRLYALDGTAELETLDSNGRHGALAGGEDGPHVRAQCIDRALQVFQPRREGRGAGETCVDVVEQTPEGGQLLSERLVRHNKTLDRRWRLLTSDLAAAALR